MLAHLLAETVNQTKTGNILLCRDNQFGRGKGSVGAIDQFHVLGRENMVVAKGKWGQLRYQRLQVVRHLLGRGNAGEQKGMMVLQFMKVRRGLGLLEYRQQFTIVDGREEQSLVGIEIHGLGDDTILHGFQVLRTLRDNDNVCTVLATQWLAQSASRQQRVVDNQSVVVDQQDVDAGFDITVLEGIVQEDDIDILVVLQ